MVIREGERRLCKRDRLMLDSAVERGYCTMHRFYGGEWELCWQHCACNRKILIAVREHRKDATVAIELEPAGRQFLQGAERSIAEVLLGHNDGFYGSGNFRGWMIERVPVARVHDQVVMQKVVALAYELSVLYDNAEGGGNAARS